MLVATIQRLKICIMGSAIACAGSIDIFLISKRFSVGDHASSVETVASIAVGTTFCVLLACVVITYLVHARATRLIVKATANQKPPPALRANERVGPFIVAAIDPNTLTLARPRYWCAARYAAYALLTCLVMLSLLLKFFSTPLDLDFYDIVVSVVLVLGSVWAMLRTITTSVIVSRHGADWSTLSVERIGVRSGRTHVVISRQRLRFCGSRERSSVIVVSYAPLAGTSGETRRAGYLSLESMGRTTLGVYQAHRVARAMCERLNVTLPAPGTSAASVIA